MNPRTLIPASEFKARREARDTATAYRAMLERYIAKRRYALDAFEPRVGFAELGEIAASRIDGDEPGAA